jgi:hypothetical protein
MGGGLMRKTNEEGLADIAQLRIARNEYSRDECDKADRLTGANVVEFLSRLGLAPDNASLFQNFIHDRLEKEGFYVAREVPGIKGNGRMGRIDLVVYEDIAIVGMELDHQTIRWRSLGKLRRFDGFRICVLRLAKPWIWQMPTGIDSVICIPVVNPLSLIDVANVALLGTADA